MKKNPRTPVCHLVAGPNGAGKSTFALEHLPALAKCSEFLNADLIAAGLSPLEPARSGLRAARLVLEKIDELARSRTPFGFESTLSGRTYLATLAKLKSAGFRICLYYLWLPSPKISIQRIKGRVKLGGHHVPAVDVRRRFARSLANLHAYQQIADEFFAFDASTCPPRPVFSRIGPRSKIEDASLFEKIQTRLGEI
jgi:predicted ABC-type ATPase